MGIALALAHHELLHEGSQLALVLDEGGLAKADLLEDFGLGVGGDVSDFLHTVRDNVHVLLHVHLAGGAVELLAS